MKEFIVEKSLNGIRLDKFILLKYDVNESFLFIMQRKKLVRVNGNHPKDYKMTLNEGDSLKFFLDDNLVKEEKNAKPNFDIVYEDNNILIIDKKEGVLVHSVKSDDHNNLTDYVTNYLIKKNEYIPSIQGSFRPSPNNRLDAYTKGLIIFSKNKEALKEINTLIEKRKIKKRYLTVIYGNTKKDSHVFKDYILIDEKKGFAKISKTEVEGSKSVITGYERIKNDNDLTLLKIDLITGRTHQIRCHLAYYGLPVLGDNKYGNRMVNDKYHLNHQELLSYELEFDGVSGMFEYLNGKTFKSKQQLEIMKRGRLK